MLKNSSKYFLELSSDDKHAYIKKLTFTDGTVLPDPFGITDGQWESNILLLPDVTFGDLYTYLIETPSEYTHENIKAYKSLEAHNFFLNGHVQDVFYHDPKNSNMCYIKSSVLPSQRQGKKEKLYSVWLILSKTGSVLTANCTCMAG